MDAKTSMDAVLLPKSGFKLEVLAFLAASKL